MFFGIHLCLSFLLPYGIHLFPITSSASPPASLSLSHRPHSSSLPSTLSISSLEAERPCFSAEIGAQGQGESSSAKCLESFSAVSTRTNSSSLLLNGFPIWHRRSPFFYGPCSSPVLSPSFGAVLRFSVCAQRKGECLYRRVWVVGLARSLAFLRGLIDLTNCQPCFILSKWHEQSGGDGARRLIRKQSHLYGN